MSKSKDEDIQNFYKTFLVSSAKNPANLKGELLYQLYKTPQKDKGENMPHMVPVPPNTIQQADILYLPEDDGYKYGLTVVDTGSRLTDVEPMKERTSENTLKAIQAIYKRGILKMPSDQMQVDKGSEFEGDFKKFFEEKGVFVRFAQTGRSKQQALVEARNYAIARPLLMRMTAQELRTGETSREWIEFLPTVIKFLNSRYEVKYKPPTLEEDFAPSTCEGQSCKLLNVGDLVRYQLDKPVDVVSEKRLKGKFRSGDIRWSMKPVKIIYLNLNPDQPPMYKLEGLNALYTRNQLQPVDESPNLPPDETQKKFVIEKIIGKKTEKKKILYEVKWKGYDETTFEPRENLLKEVPELVKEFDEKKQETPKPEPEPEPEPKSKAKGKAPKKPKEEKFIIEKIIGRKKENNRVFFEVKWKGYKETTFEPRTTLIKDVPQLVKEFEKSK